MTLTVDPVVMAMITVAWTSVGTLAGFVYKELKAQIADRDVRIKTLDESAAAAVRAKDAEIAEWKARALQEPTRGKP